MRRLFFAMPLALFLIAACSSSSPFDPAENDQGQLLPAAMDCSPDAFPC
jgi:uncharacterized protein YcfL